MALKILNKCPICGGKLEYYELMQYSLDYKIKKNGRLAKRYKKGEAGPMECGFIGCTICDFLTNCDLEVEEKYRFIRIYQKGEVFMYEDKRETQSK